MSVGMPIWLAASSVAALAYPPTPTAMSGAKSRIIFFTRRLALRKSRATPMFDSDHNGRLKPRTGSPTISYPAAGTRCISILPSAPTKSIFASGRFAFIALAIDTAGKICPPVPPPLTMTLNSFSIVMCFFQITKLIIFSDKADYCAFFIVLYQFYLLLVRL